MMMQFRDLKLFGETQRLHQREQLAGLFRQSRAVQAMDVQQ